MSSNEEQPRNLRMGLAGRMHRSHISHVFIRELRPRVRFSARYALRMSPRAIPIPTGTQLRMQSKWMPVPTSYEFRMETKRMPIPAGRSTLLRHIRHIFIIRSHPKVSRIAAGTIIPIRTIVQNQQALGNRPVLDDPCNAVSADGRVLDRDTSISAIELTTSPRPTRVRTARAIDTRPESLNITFRKSRDWFRISHSHHLLTGVSVRGGIGVCRTGSPSYFTTNPALFALIKIIAKEHRG